MTPEHNETYLEAINECVNEAIDKEETPEWPTSPLSAFALTFLGMVLSKKENEIQEETDE